ncbi:phosphopantetheine-binding protein, partial [Nocardia brasiliensis]|uniref:phosphopantetheine-binding protein n=1 Tax=Nocardia brasiliensis TaxID=37326 RepID=UPI0024571B4B
FFELGGNSLVATQVVARLSAALGTEGGVGARLEAPTVAAPGPRGGYRAGGGGGCAGRPLVGAGGDQ